MIGPPNLELRTWNLEKIENPKSENQKSLMIREDSEKTLKNLKMLIFDPFSDIFHFLAQNGAKKIAFCLFSTFMIP